jgi:exosortase J
LSVPLETRSPNSVTTHVTRPVSLTLKPQTVVALACLCAAVGLFAICNTVLSLMDIWQTDALKSVGLAVPFVCFALIFRDWRSIGWETEGTWWGFALLAGGVFLVFLRDQMLLIVTVNKDWLLQLPPLPLIAVLYAASLVLLFGGTRLLRAAWFPVLLMWAVIPVPQTFSRRVDVPLQHAGAIVARNFAHLIGVRLSSMDLRIMFSPTTGMFIAPGCDGLRGSITMGLTAIAVAYYYRFRWFVFLPIVIAGILLGYVFNFLRLCSMVIYDRISVSYPRLGPHEQLADHIVGACIFVIALVIFFTAIEKLKRPSAALSPSPTPRDRVPAWPTFGKAAAVLVLATVFGADYLHSTPAAAATSTVYPPLPASIGSYHLVRTWLDQTSEGIVVYMWGEYAAPDKAPGVPGDHVSLGISPRMSIHDAEVCHIARGEDPTWHGQIAAVSPGGPLDLTAVMYNNGAYQRLEASTVCDGGSCRQYSETGQHITLVYARPHKDLPMQADLGRPTPVLLKVESLDTMAPAGVMEPQLAARLTEFLKSANLAGLTAPYSTKR